MVQIIYDDLIKTDEADLVFSVLTRALLNPPYYPKQVAARYFEIEQKVLVECLRIVKENKKHLTTEKVDFMIRRI